MEALSQKRRKKHKKEVDQKYMYLVLLTLVTIYK